jgi:citrate lyase beta subunit
MIETPGAYFQMAAIASSSKRLVGMSIGGKTSPPKQGWTQPRKRC